jgi:membrane-associated phospholipid phosphatase
MMRKGCARPDWHAVSIHDARDEPYDTLAADARARLARRRPARSTMSDARATATLLFGTGREMLRAVVRWRTAQWWCWLALVGSAGLAWANKRPLQSLLEGRGHGAADVMAAFANVCGGGVAVTLVGVGVFVVGYFLHKDALVDAAIVLGVAGCWCFVLVQLGQFVFAEQRPIEGGGMRFFGLGGHGISGHAAATALLLLPTRDVLLRGRRPLARHLATAALLVWVGIVAWSRVWMGMHHAWNVLAGLALGLWTSAAAVAAWRESERQGRWQVECLTSR